jgi:hypothetical protein
MNTLKARPVNETRRRRKSLNVEPAEPFHHVTAAAAAGTFHCVATFLMAHQREKHL